MRYAYARAPAVTVVRARDLVRTPRSGLALVHEGVGLILAAARNALELMHPAVRTNESLIFPLASAVVLPDLVAVVATGMARTELWRL